MASSQISTNPAFAAAGNRPRTLAWLGATTEGLLFAMMVFAPWAFGTTQPWSIWCMNSAAYVLGGMLVATSEAIGSSCPLIAILIVSTQTTRHPNDD